MKLHLLSINVHDINNDQKGGVIENYVDNLTPKVDVLCLQEHKFKRW